MKLSVRGLQPLLVHMCVDLRRRNISVTKHFLDDSQVCAIAKQVRRKTMAEQVRINIGLQSRMPRARLHDLPNADSR
jgi:hypothetical protein